MGFKYTKDQQKVIDLRERNILVAAAAGSGKTAVLVERIIQLISGGENPTDIDRLLIVTFTSAAADEMRERIGEAIEKYLDEKPGCEHMQKQATLIYRAQITTISSFCLNIIKNHFHDIALDPALRVADAGECTLMKADVLADVLETFFEKKEKEFYDFVEVFSTSGSEKGLEELILQLYEASRSNTFPIQWLKSCEEAYKELETQELSQLSWAEYMVTYTKTVLGDCAEQLAQLETLCEQSDGPYMYKELLEMEKSALCNMSQFNDVEKLYQGINEFKFGRLSSKKDDIVSVEKRELVKEIRNDIKSDISKLKEKFYYDTSVNQLNNMKKTGVTILMLVKITLDFYSAYQKEKRRKGILDFSDMEHYALDILVKRKESSTKGEATETAEATEITLEATNTAMMYQKYFTEILIDEYQDSNLVQEYLLKSISKEWSGQYNQFMVGDVKQSIYKFRLARPELFMEKYGTYKTEDSNMQKIDLSQNFRSREEVLSTVNYIFEQIMIPQVGGISYDEKATLSYGANYEIVTDQEQTTELLIMEQLESKDDKKELEARMISKRIHELVESFRVTDKKTGELRLAEYGDIVILVRSNAGWDETFKEVLEREGIPAHIASKTGYFSAYEIQLVLHFLRVFDNPLQDISITTILLSGVIGFAEEELAIIKGEWKEATSKKKIYLYFLLEWYLENGNNERLASKIEKVIAFINYYRQMTVYTPINELIEALLQEEKLQLYLTTLPRGEQRKANLDMLLEKAIQFEQTSYHGLFHFVRYIEQLEKYEVNYGEANILDEKANVVRIMSIHKSKGLEFPICFVAGLAKTFNKMDIRKNVVIDMDYKIGMNYINPEARTKTKTLQKEVMVQKMEVDNIGEEIRILYVALTRAKEKLIMTSVTKSMEKTIKSAEKHKVTNSSQFSFSQIKKAKSFMDLILMGLARHPDWNKITGEIKSCGENKSGDKANVNIKIFQKSDVEYTVLEQAIRKEVNRQQFIEQMKLAVSDSDLSETIQRNFAYTYPYKALAEIYSKTTVTELKRKRMLEELEEAEELVQDEQVLESSFKQGSRASVPATTPAFIQAKALKATSVSGMERGNAYHKVMEVLPLEEIDSVEEALLECVKRGYLSEPYYQLIECEKIEKLVNSKLWDRMVQAGLQGALYKEQPFVISIPANEVEARFPKEEEILLQGIVDVYFEENGELVILDYKTDKVKTVEELKERYEIQVKYYATSLAKLTGKVVKEIILYSFALSEMCSIKTGYA